jgi:hypothetical protein
LNDDDGFRKALNPSYAASVSLPAQRIERPVIACDKREAFAQGSPCDEAIHASLPRYRLLRGACHRAARCADPVARNDGLKTLDVFAV